MESLDQKNYNQKSFLIARNLTILFTCFYFIFKFYQKLLKPLKNLTC
jgi:hypothetical protein